VGSAIASSVADLRHIGLARLSLGIERIELKLEPLLAGVARVDGTTELTRLPS
jgi:hypothetical protein